MAVGLAVLVVVSAAVAGVAVFSAGAVATSQTAASGSTPIKFVYVDGGTGHVTFVREDGTKVETNRSADIVGSMADLDNDGNLEAPFVTSQGEIWAIDENNETQFVANQTYNSNTKLSVGDWTGDGTPEVLYANTSDNDYLSYANLTGTPTQIAPKSAKAVVGLEDFTGSGERELLYMGSTSKNLWYYNESGGATNTEYGNFASGGTAGAPVDFHRDGERWIPAIDGSGYIELVNASGDADEITTSNVDKTPVAGVNWTDSAQLEVVVVKSNVIEYTFLNGTRRTLNDASGNSISAKQGAGIAGVASRNDALLSVTGFEASASGKQNVTATVETDEKLASMNVSLSGPENATLTLADGNFSTNDSSAPYSYTATYDASTDGNYTGALEKIESTDGDVVNSAQTDSVTIDEVGPSIDSVSIADATDGNGFVDTGDTVTVTANVTSDVGTVSADLSAFGAGNVTLTQANGDTYDASVQVGANATAGNQSASVTAKDGQGNQNASTTGTLEVDTADLTVSLESEKTVTEDEQVSFSPQLVRNASGNVTYNWSFGDGSSETGKSVTHTFQTSGTYSVTVNATDEAGDSAEASMPVDVEATVSTNSITTETNPPTSSPVSTEPDTTTNGESSTTTTKTATTTATTTTTASTKTTTTESTTAGTATGTSETTTTTPDDTGTTTTVTTETPNTTTTGDDEGGSAIGEAPGFGVGLALISMLGAAVLARRE